MVDAITIIDSYSERSPHIYKIKSSELYALNKRGERTEPQGRMDLSRLQCKSIARRHQDSGPQEQT